MQRGGKRLLSKIFGGGSRGATLVEVLIAVVVLALITSSVPPVLLLLVNSEYRWTEQTVAESLARTQMEFVKGCTYIPGIYINGTVQNPNYGNVSVPDSSYQITVDAVPLKLLPRERVQNEHLGTARRGNGDDVFKTEHAIVIVNDDQVVRCGVQVLSEGSSGYEIERGEVAIKNDTLQGNVTIDYWHRPHELVNLPGGEQDAGLQLITVNVYHVGKLILTAIDYKVNR